MTGRRWRRRSRGGPEEETSTTGWVLQKTRRKHGNSLHYWGITLSISSREGDEFGLFAKGRLGHSRYRGETSILWSGPQTCTVYELCVLKEEEK